MRNKELSRLLVSEVYPRCMGWIINPLQFLLINDQLEDTLVLPPLRPTNASRVQQFCSYHVVSSSATYCVFVWLVRVSLTIRVRLHWATILVQLVKPRETTILMLFPIWKLFHALSDWILEGSSAFRSSHEVTKAIDARRGEPHPKREFVYQSPLTNKRPLKLISLKRHITDIFECNVSSIFWWGKIYLISPVIERENFLFY